MSSTKLQLQNPRETYNAIVTFIARTLNEQDKSSVVVAVSGGIDSAVSVSAAVHAVGASAVYPVLLPYGSQDMQDAAELLMQLEIPRSNTTKLSIDSVVHSAAQTLGLHSNPRSQKNKHRLGNIMARARMILVYDSAAKRDALVCGTENKSEKYLGYFTRFGDEASDIEPLQHLYKTQVRQIAAEIGLPGVFLNKAPSAGLWKNQTDETELGFTYEEADAVLSLYVDEQLGLAKIISQTGIPKKTVQAVIARVTSQSFKHRVPYTIAK